MRSSLRHLLLCSVLIASCEVPLVVQSNPDVGGASGNGIGGDPNSAGAGADTGDVKPPEGGEGGAGGSDTPAAGAAGDGTGGMGPDVLTPCPRGRELKALVISAGESHACAIEAPTGHLYCWGAGQSGQLGDGQTLDSNVPVRALPERQYSDVKVGAVFTCALASEGDLYCFGDNFDGQLANMTEQGSASPVLTLSGVEQFALGAGYVLASTSDDELYVWGSNDHGQLGLGDAAVDQVLRQETGVGISARLLTAGYRHACIAAADTLYPYCAGTNQGSRLGIPGTDSSVFTRVSQGAVESISAGFDRTCTVGRGMLVCWGANVPTTFVGRPAELTMPMQVGTSEEWQNVSVGFDHVCGNKTGDYLVCAGDNSQGELGTPGSASPDFIATEPRFRSSRFSAGRDFTCAIREPDSAVVCFGSNQNGKLGRGSSDASSSRPALVCLP